MSPKILINRLEIHFWNKVIPLMEQSLPVRFIVSRTYLLANQFLTKEWLLLGLGCVAAGGFLGFALGVLSHYR